MPPISSPSPRTTGAGERLDDGDVEPEAPRRGGHLAADEAGADHDHPLRRGDQVGPEGERSRRSMRRTWTPVEVGPARDAAGRRAGGDRRARRSRGGRRRRVEHPPGADVERRGRLRPARHSASRSSASGGRRPPAPACRRGPAWTAAGGRRGGAARRRPRTTLAVEALGPQRLGGAEPGERCADDGDRDARRPTSVTPRQARDAVARRSAAPSVEVGGAAVEAVEEAVAEGGRPARTGCPARRRRRLADQQERLDGLVEVAGGDAGRCVGSPVLVEVGRAAAPGPRRLRVASGERAGPGAAEAVGLQERVLAVLEDAEQLLGDERVLLGRGSRRRRSRRSRRRGGPPRRCRRR